MVENNQTHSHFLYVWNTPRGQVGCGVPDPIGLVMSMGYSAHEARTKLATYSISFLFLLEIYHHVRDTVVPLYF